MTATGGNDMPGDAPDGHRREFTHLDAHGRARMVDVTSKPVTLRLAVARCVVRADPAAIERAMKAEDAAALARAAGLNGAKQTSALVPLCHPLPLDDVNLQIEHGHGAVAIRATTTVVARTGVEMEALTACALAGLTMVMHMLPFDPGATLSTLGLWHKSGGRSGTWEREEPAAG